VEELAVVVVVVVVEQVADVVATDATIIPPYI
jgi:hypothetical protein